MYSGIFMYSVLPTYLRLGGKGVKDSIYNIFSLNKKNIYFDFMLNLHFAITQLTLRVTIKVALTKIQPNSIASSKSPGVSHGFSH